MENALAVELLLIAAVFFVAVLYSSVGHGGASGYLAVMAFFAVAPAAIRPTALILNVFVAAIGTVQFYRRGHFDPKLFLSFAAASIPFAFLGGMIVLPVPVYKKILGAVLFFAAFRLAWKFSGDGEEGAAGPKIWVALLAGALIGLLSGLVGVGGGIFLTPLLLLLNWSEAKTAAGISAAFILVNSVAGLVGNYTRTAAAGLGPEVALWIAAAVFGGIIGTTLGSKYFNSLALRRVLAAVLVIAGIKLIFI